MARRHRARRQSAAARALTLGTIMALVNVGSASGASLPIAVERLTSVTRTYGAARTCSIGATSDSYANKALATTNFGTGTTLLVSADSTATERAFVRFDLTSCAPTIPGDALVQSAEVQLTVGAVALATRTYELRRTTSAWVETTVTWNVQPTVAGSTVSATVPLGTLAATVIEWTATSEVQAYATGALSDLGWRIGDSSEGIVLGTPLAFGSREAATGQPRLVVTYLP